LFKIKYLRCIAQDHCNAARQLLHAGADATVRVHDSMTVPVFAQKNRQSQLDKILRCAGFRR